MTQGHGGQRSHEGLRPASGSPWRKRLFVIIFESETFGGRLFDVVLIVSILLSVVVVMLASVKDLWDAYAVPLTVGWWIFTILFTVEYVLRIICVGKPLRYIISFFGIVDLLAILPAYLGLIFRGGRFLSVVRILRVLRVFRILNLKAYASEAQNMLTALKNSQRRITIFFIFIITLTVILGSVMYVIEGGQQDGGFSSIPQSIYWAVVTITTVGYGDISPQTGLGQFIAGVAMIMGYSIIVVPTGLVSVEFARIKHTSGHVNDEGRFCKHCGNRL